MNTPHINDVRLKLMAALDGLADKENPMEVDRAKAIGQLASVLVDTAKVEIEYIKTCGGASTSSFIEKSQPHTALTDARGANNPFQLANQNH